MKRLVRKFAISLEFTAPQQKVDARVSFMQKAAGFALNAGLAFGVIAIKFTHFRQFDHFPRMGEGTFAFGSETIPF